MRFPSWRGGQGVYLQRYKDGGLIDAATFTWKTGLKDENGRLFEPSELKDWRGERCPGGPDRAARLGQEREIR